MDDTHSVNHGDKQTCPSPVRRTPARRWLIGVLVVLSVGLGLPGYQFGCSRAGDSLPPAIVISPGAASGFNVVLFTLDTLRADRVGCYGHKGVETPTLDALAAGGVRFADAVTAVPTTLASHSTIMTGNYPPVHGVRNNGTYRLVEQHETLAERLKEEGYATAAFIGAFVLDRRYGLAQGFDLYDDDITQKYRAPGTNPLYPERPGNVVTDAALRWVEEYRAAQTGRPFFTWIHLFDPHAPHTPPEPFKTRYAARPYDGEVAFTDQQVGRFLDKLRQLKLFDKTLIVVVSDHGEGLGDHGERTHGLLIYESTMRVPLIFHAPTVIARARVVDDRVVATVDVAPTILDLLGFGPGDCDGTSLLRSNSRRGRAVYVETLAPKLSHGWSPLYGLRRHDDKYIAAPTPEYYDLRSDPGENQNLWQQRSAEAVALADRLDVLRSSFPSEEQTRDAAITPSAEALRKLAALGYVSGTAPAQLGPPPDPKEMVLAWERRLKGVRQLVGRGRFAEAIPPLKEALAVTPNDPELWLLLSDVQATSSLYDDAIASRLKAIELLPIDSGEQWVQLARLQYHKGDVAAASRSLAEAERLEPEHGEICLIRAEMALDAGQYQAALRHCAEARRRDPTRHTLASWLIEGRVYEQMGELANARSAFERAHEADPADMNAVLDLADLALQEGRHQRVVEFAGKVPARHALWPRSRVLLARAHFEAGQADEAIRILERLLESAPRYAAAYTQAATMLTSRARPDRAIEVLRRGHALLPEDPAIANHLAWLLATAPDARLRDGAKAVALAELADQLTGGRYASALDTLAAAYAEAGRFDEAVSAARRALALARQAGDDDMVSEIEARLSLYRTRQAYHQP